MPSLSFFLFVRMVILYPLFALLAANGTGVFNPEAGTFLVNIDDVASFFIGVVGYAGTFLLSRFSKARGGQT